LQRLVSDPEARRVHFDLLPAPEDQDPLELHHLDGLRLKANLRGLEALSSREQMEIMLDRATLEAVVRDVSLRPAETAAAL
jgi:hypothetical protein